MKLSTLHVINEYLLVETIFLQLLQLPLPTHKPLYLTVLVIDLCKTLPKVLPPVLFKIVSTLFNSIEDLDHECQKRMGSWLALHLSNLAFNWLWDDWVFVATQPEDSAARLFVEEV